MGYAANVFTLMVTLLQNTPYILKI